MIELIAKPLTVKTPDKIRDVIAEQWEILDRNGVYYLIKAGNQKFIIAVVDVETVFIGRKSLFYVCEKNWARNSLPSGSDLRNFPFFSCQTGRNLAVHEIDLPSGPLIRSEYEAIKNFDGLVGVGKTNDVPEPFSADWFKERDEGRKRAAAKREAVKKMKQENRKCEAAYWKAIGKMYTAEDSEIERSMRKSAG